MMSGQVCSDVAYHAREIERDADDDRVRELAREIQQLAARGESA